MSTVFRAGVFGYKAGLNRPVGLRTVTQFYLFIYFFIFYMAGEFKHSGRSYPSSSDTHHRTSVPILRTFLQHRPVCQGKMINLK